MNVITEYPNLKAPFNQNSVKLEKNSRTIEDVPTKVPTEEVNTVQDKFVKSSDNDTGIYSRETILNQIRETEQQRIEAFQKMIQSLISEQANSFKLSVYVPSIDGSSVSLVDLNVTQEAIDKAKIAISEDGEYGVNAVAERIMNMAKALAGGDNSKLELLRNAVTKGFDFVKNLYGDNYPEICQNTYTEVMNRFDEWQKSIDEPPTYETIQSKK
ncbi:MAG: hypothetical protein GX286_03220 [Clostridiales bacterium]|jgi:hypothetical protein|nr:hypothetical protein [Clostridiales bacterium]